MANTRVLAPDGSLVYQHRLGMQFYEEDIDEAVRRIQERNMDWEVFKSEARSEKPTAELPSSFLHLEKDNKGVYRIGRKDEP